MGIVLGWKDGEEQVAVKSPALRPRLLDQVRDVVRRRHYSLRTEQAYIHWIKRFILFHGKRHPRQIGAREVEAFLTHLAVVQKVSASTQNQALNALVFLYHHVLLQELGTIENVERAKRPVRLPVVLTVEEVRAVLAGAQIPPCRPRMGMAVCLSGIETVDRSDERNRAEASYRPDGVAAGSQTGGSDRGFGKACKLPHPTPFLRNAPVAGRLRYTNGTGATRPCGCLNDNDLYPRAQPRRARGGQSSGCLALIPRVGRDPEIHTFRRRSR